MKKSQKADRRYIKYLVLTTQRTGSTWLLDVLNHQNSVEGHEELFYGEARKSPAVAGCNEYLRFVEIYGKGSLLRPLQVFSYLNGLYSREGAIGFKLMYSHLRAYPEILIYIAVRPIHIIHLIRQNHLDVIISSEVAKVTGRSHITVGEKQEESIRVHIDTAKLMQNISRQVKNIQKARTILKLLFCPVLEVYYEKLRESETEFNRICEFLGIDARNIEIESNLKKRVNRKHSEIIDNYDQVVEVLKGSPYENLLNG